MTAPACQHDYADRANSQYQCSSDSSGTAVNHGSLTCVKRGPRIDLSCVQRALIRFVDGSDSFLESEKDHHFGQSAIESLAVRMASLECGE